MWMKGSGPWASTLMPHLCFFFQKIPLANFGASHGPLLLHMFFQFGIGKKKCFA